MKKFIAVLLTVLLVSSLALPTVAFAAGEVVDAPVAEEGPVDNDHTTPEEFWDMMTNEDGSVNWKELPKALFNAALIVTLFEIIANAIRESFDSIFGTIAGWLPDWDDGAADNTVEVESEVAA